MQSRRAFFLAAGISVASAAVPAKSAAQSRGVIRMAGTLSDSFGPTLYAKDSGAFARRGFGLDVSSLQNVGAVLAAMTGGSLDMGVADLLSGVKAIIAGAPLVVVAAGGLYLSSEPTSILAVTPNSPIRAGRDLGGKTVAVPTLGALAADAMLSWLPQNGVDPSAVKLIEVPQPVVASALERGTIDAGLIGEPFIAGAGDRIRDIGHPFDAIAKQFPISVWYANRRWVDDDLARAREAVAAVYDMARWVNAHRAESAAVLERDAHFDADILKRMIRTRWSTSLSAADCQPVLNFATRYKIFDRHVDAGSVFAKVS